MRHLLWIVLLLLVGCQPDPTPFPVSVPSTPTATADAAQVALADLPVRYALAPNTLDSIPNLELIAADAQVTQLTEPINPADLTTTYDIIAGYGDLPSGTRSPVTPHVSLLLNPQSPPFNDAALASILLQAVDMRAIVNTLAIPGISLDADTSADTLVLRTALANAGFPDGLEVNAVSAYAPATEAVRSTLSAAGIDSHWGLLSPELVEGAMNSGRVQLALVVWTSPEGKSAWQAIVGEANMMDLFNLPISYLAADGLTITFASNGFPLATR